MRQEEVARMIFDGEEEVARMKFDGDVARMKFDGDVARMKFDEDIARMMFDDLITSEALGTRRFIGFISAAGVVGAAAGGGLIEDKARMQDSFVLSDKDGGGLEIGGEVNLEAGIQVARLALEHCQNKKQQQRNIVFVGSSVKYDKKVLELIGKKLKTNSVALDIVNFGEEDEEKKEKLEALLAAVNKNDSSHIVHVPPGPSALSDVLISTPIFTGDGEGVSGFPAGSAPAEFDFSVDLDPEHSLARHVLMKVERARQEAAAKKTSEEAAKQEKGEPFSLHDATMTENVTIEAFEPESKTHDLTDDDNALLQQTLAMSMDYSSSTAAVRDTDMSGPAGFDLGVDPNLDPELTLALHASMEVERERQEAAAKKASEEAAKHEMGEPSSLQDATMTEHVTIEAFEPEKKTHDLAMIKGDSEETAVEALGTRRFIGFISAAGVVGAAAGGGLSEDKARMQDSFVLSDKDGDLMTSEELATSMRSLGLKDEMFEGHTLVEVEEIAAELNVVPLDYEEFRPAGELITAEEDFKLLNDKDQDDLISAAEVVGAAAGGGLSEDKAHMDSFVLSDKDGDDLMTSEELATSMRSLGLKDEMFEGDTLVEVEEIAGELKVVSLDYEEFRPAGELITAEEDFKLLNDKDQDDLISVAETFEVDLPKTLVEIEEVSAAMELVSLHDDGPRPVGELVQAEGPRRLRIILCATFTLSVSDLPEIVESFKEIGNILVVATKDSLHKFEENDIEHIITDQRRWELEDSSTVPQELVEWADYLIVVPLSSNTLAKIALGIADNLVTSVIKEYPARYMLVPDMSENHWYSSTNRARLHELVAKGHIVCMPGAGGQMTRNYKGVAEWAARQIREELH